MQISRLCLSPVILILCMLAGPRLQTWTAPAVAALAGNLAVNAGLPANAGATGPADRQPAVGNRLIHDFHQAIAHVQPLLIRYGYPALFLAVLVEGFGLVAPGQSLLIAAAFTAARGGLNLFWVVLLAFTAATVGNSLGYLLGARGGRPLLHKLRVNENHLLRLERYFSRYGKGIVIIARFFDGLRQLNGIVAGLLHMPWRAFTICNILGAALWAGVWGVGTYFLEKEIATVHLTVRLVEPLIAALTLLGVLALLIYILWPGRRSTS
jgi:membrane protein DedA with SNARE-associated domain